LEPFVVVVEGLSGERLHSQMEIEATEGEIVGVREEGEGGKDVVSAGTGVF